MVRRARDTDMEKTMSIWDRLARVARSELSEIKRVLADQDDPAAAPDAAGQRAQAIAEAEAELARADRDVLAARFEMGAAGWEVRPEADPELERGASLWARDGAAASPSPAPGSESPARTTAIPRDIREAYAALELPLGADADAVERAHAALIARFGPERFADDPARHGLATSLRSRFDGARAMLLAWLARA